jgi:hypothetical protein
VAVRTKAYVCGRSLTGMAGSNPTGGVDVSFECCVLSLRRADHSSRGVMPSVIVKPRYLEGPGPLGAVAQWGQYAVSV